MFAAFGLVPSGRRSFRYWFFCYWFFCHRDGHILSRGKTNVVENRLVVAGQ
jgi:hypothetical protein